MARPEEVTSIRGGICSSGDVEPSVKAVWRDYNKLQNYIEAVDYIGV